MTTASTIDRDEIERFSRISAEWWNPDGPFRPLHRLNPVRMSYIRNQAAGHFGTDPKSVTPLKGLKAIDIGCGGGLVAEPLARMGAKVTAIDADANAIVAAQAHAASRGVTVDYRVAAIEDIKGKFDLVLALEIVEHVSDPALFLESIGRRLAPGGLLILSTLNRTLKSLLLGVGMAEYVLRWVAPGTHDWRKFQRPSELTRALGAAGFEVADLTGLVFDPLSGEFRLSTRDLKVNYFAAARRAE